MTEQRQTREEGTSSTKVRLLIYSGRADPEWSLTDEQAAHLAALADKATGAQAIHPVNVPGGYRGFLVTLSSAAKPSGEIREQYLVCTKVLSRRDKSGQFADWLDVSGVERFLLHDAVEHGHGDVLRTLGALPTEA